MRDYSFAKAVRSAIGDTVDNKIVPCFRPYSGMELLQFIDKEHLKLKTFGKWKALRKAFKIVGQNQTEVLLHAGINRDTLITRLDDHDLKGDLMAIVAQARASPTYVSPLNPSRTKSMKVGIYASVELNGSDLAMVGLKMINDNNWNLVFGDGKVTKWEVSRHDLSDFYKRPNARWNIDDIKGVVTAIYFTSGGLTFQGRRKNVASGEVELQAPNVIVNIGASWCYKVTDDGFIVVKEQNPRDWIVAISYQPFESRRHHEQHSESDSESEMSPLSAQGSPLYITTALFLIPVIMAVIMVAMNPQVAPTTDTAPRTWYKTALDFFVHLFDGRWPTPQVAEHRTRGWW